MCNMEGFTLFCNDSQSLNSRPYGDTAIYNGISNVPGFPYSCNTNGIELTVVGVSALLNITVIAIYPQISLTVLCQSLVGALRDFLRIL